MTDKFYPISLNQLLKIILEEYKREHSIFGIPKELFFDPTNNKQFETKQFGQSIDTPIELSEPSIVLLKYFAIFIGSLKLSIILSCSFLSCV